MTIASKSGLVQAIAASLFATVGDAAAARAAYQDFFPLWKDADADLPVLIQAKAEYAKLQQLNDGVRVAKSASGTRI